MNETESFWVFGYGSLMWNPGFNYEEVQTATIYGYHRSLCVYSWHFRGTQERPGLVLGLDRGGCCKGRAFRINATQKEQVMTYLTEREMITDFYNPKWVPAHVGKQVVSTYTFVADSTHEQYAGGIPLEQTISLLLQGEGRGGSSIDYLKNVIEHLDDLSIPDGPLHKLLSQALSCK
ncbi:MAG: gamma-glutamylcyclotransferase [Rhodospirillales bacterium]|nr:gamma-glutamylcyclotransferase [Rhodospirillales bacterium]